MPASPPAIFVPTSSGGEPDSPPAIFVPTSGGGEPDSPPAIHVPASAARFTAILVSGATPSGANGELIETSQVLEGRRTWSNTGSSTATAYPFLKLAWDTGEDEWVYTYAPDDTGVNDVQWMSADADTDPLDAGSWTPGTGAGGTIVFTGGHAGPPAIFVPTSGGGEPDSAPAIFVPTSGGGEPDSPPAIFIPTSGGGEPDSAPAIFVPAGVGGDPSSAPAIHVPSSSAGATASPPAIFGMPLHVMTDTDNAVLTDTDGAILTN